MTDELRTTLHRLADDATPRPVADDLWRRGRAARRRGRAFAVAAALALVVSVGGAATLLAGPDRETRTASTEEVPQGAIPSRIDDVPVERPVEEDLAVGRASVAFVSSAGQAMVIGASDGLTRALDISIGAVGPLALSPDGRRLAWPWDGELQVLDLESGDVMGFAHNGGRGAFVTSLAWRTDSSSLTWLGTDDDRADVGGVLDVTGPSEVVGDPTRPEARGAVSPAGDVVALPTRGAVAAAPFLRAGRGPGGGPGGERVGRSLPSDLYPRGAAVQPLGWASETLVVAEVHGTTGSYAEGPHLVLFTAPVRPESEWTWRIMVRDLPAIPMSVAVDLVPDLDGTSSQALTHDFGDPDADQDPLAWTGIEPSLLIGLGVAAAIAVLMALRWFWRRIWLWRRPLG
jgi:hypothetical protein